MGLQRGHIKAATVSITGIRTLARTDLSLLTEKRPAVTLQKLRDTHHRIARAVAGGLSNADVAAICGISLNRVSMLKADPSFIDLVAHYRATVTADWVASSDSFLEIATANMLKAERMLSDELDQHDEEGTRPSVKDLIAISRDAADRFGYGKMQKNLNVNVDFAAQLEGARKRSRAPRLENVVDNRSTDRKSDKSPQRAIDSGDVRFGDSVGTTQSELRSMATLIEASSLVPQSDPQRNSPAPVEPAGGPSTFRRL